MSVPMTRINESCSCGASLEIEAADPLSAENLDVIDNWRDSHAGCRGVASTTTTRVPQQRPIPPMVEGASEP